MPLPFACPHLPIPSLRAEAFGNIHILCKQCFGIPSHFFVSTCFTNTNAKMSAKPLSIWIEKQCHQCSRDSSPECMRELLRSSLLKISCHSSDEIVDLFNGLCSQRATLELTEMYSLCKEIWELLDHYFSDLNSLIFLYRGSSFLLYKQNIYAFMKAQMRYCYNLISTLHCVIALTYIAIFDMNAIFMSSYIIVLSLFFDHYLIGTPCPILGSAPAWMYGLWYAFWQSKFSLHHHFLVIPAGSVGYCPA